MALVAEIHAQTPAALADAEQHYRGALALAETLGMRPLQRRCQEGLQRLSV
jgi:hypothetical protein